MTAGPLTDPELAALRDLIILERGRIERQLAGLQRTFDGLVAAADLEPPDDEHDPEGTTAYDRAQVMSLAKAGRSQLEQLDLALLAIGAGTYGICDHCGVLIGMERLEALPGTRWCVACTAAGLA
jgi:RNA polymerase-binding transcription factor DksA